jgi:hypothetical protein
VSLSAAFEVALSKLGLVDRTDPATMAVAKLIIEFAKEGERDPRAALRPRIEAIINVGARPSDAEPPGRRPCGLSPPLFLKLLDECSETRREWMLRDVVLGLEALQVLIATGSQPREERVAARRDRAFVGLWARAKPIKMARWHERLIASLRVDPGPH